MMTDTTHTPNEQTPDQQMRAEDLSPPPAHHEELAEPTESTPNPTEASSSKDLHTQSLELEIEKLKNEVLRAHANLENIRQRSKRDVDQAHAFGHQKFATALLPVLDSLEQGLQSCQDADVPETYAQGLSLTLELLQNTMAQFNITAIHPTFEPYNPDLHEAITMQPSDEHPSKTVLQVVQKGYCLKERVLRAAKVIVAS